MFAAETTGQTRGTNVLVTGATGFVGSHLVELLLEQGYSVSCLVRDPGRIRWLKGLAVRLVQGDCSVPGSLDGAVRDASIVIHAAGLTKAARANDFYSVNQLGTRNVLEACVRHSPGIKKFILISSQAAAGPSPAGEPVKAMDAPRPVSDYGKSKLLAEEETVRYNNRFPVVILRPASVYGPRDTDVFELFRWAAKGLCFELAGGERYVNACYVGDLARAILLSAERQTRSGSIYFVAENRAYAWSEFRSALLSTGGVTARSIVLPAAAGYLVGLASELAGLISGAPLITSRQKVREMLQKYWLCDLTDIERDLGFHAKYPLAQGLEITWEWYRKNGWIKERGRTH